MCAKQCEVGERKRVKYDQWEYFSPTLKTAFQRKTVLKRVFSRPYFTLLGLGVYSARILSNGKTRKLTGPTMSYSGMVPRPLRESYE